MIANAGMKLGLEFFQCHQVKYAKFKRQCTFVDRFFKLSNEIQKRESVISTRISSENVPHQSPLNCMGPDSARVGGVKAFSSSFPRCLSAIY